MESELLYKDEVFSIVGAGIEVHRELQTGYLESVYHESMELEFTDRGVPFTSQQPLRISYKGRVLKKMFVADFVCYGCVLVEIKVIARLSGTEEAQLLNYLKATGLRVGVLINFGQPGRLEWKRYVL